MGCQYKYNKLQTYFDFHTILTLDNNHLGGKMLGYSNACLYRHIPVSLICHIYRVCTPALRQLLLHAVYKTLLLPNQIIAFIEYFCQNN